MNLYRSPYTLSELWRRKLEIALEAGETPVLALGWDVLHPDSSLSVAALHHLAHRRPGAISPVIVAGGEGGLWLLGANQWPRDQHGGAMYGGNDSATFAASLTLARAIDSGSAGAGLPQGMAWMLTPTAAPGSERSEGEYLPFALAPDEFAPLPAQHPGAAMGLVGPNSDWVERAEGWAMIVLVLGLLLVALLV